MTIVEILLSKTSKSFDVGVYELPTRSHTVTHYAITLFAPYDPEDLEPPNPEDMAAHDRHSEDLQRAGVMVAAFALESPATATVLRGLTLSDGPFLESKEVVLGFCIIEAPDLDAALAIAKKNPLLQQGGSLEVRPVAWSVLVGVE
jgi:hypothetical protein